MKIVIISKKCLKKVPGMSTKKGNKEIIWLWWCCFENLVDYYDDGTETLTKEKVIKIYIVKDCIMHKEYVNVCDKTKWVQLLIKNITCTQFRLWRFHDLLLMIKDI